MKNSAITAILNGVLAISVLSCVGFSVQYFFIARQLRSLTYQATSINNRYVVLRGLVQECVEYSRTNTAIIPTLESIGIPVGKAAPVKPAAR